MYKGAAGYKSLAAMSAVASEPPDLSDVRLATAYILKFYNCFADLCSCADSCGEQVQDSGGDLQQCEAGLSRAWILLVTFTPL